MTDLHFPPGAKLPLHPTAFPCSRTLCAKAWPCQPAVAETWPWSAAWQLSCVPLGRMWHLLFAFVVLCASSASAWAGALGVPDAGTDGCSRVRAEEFSKVCQLELYRAFFLNEEALTAPNNNCEINNLWYFLLYTQLLKFFFMIFFLCDQLELRKPFPSSSAAQLPGSYRFSLLKPIPSPHSLAIPYCYLACVN